VPTLSYKEAAHRLRMTIRLLKWFESYAAKDDNRKLQFAGGLIDEKHLVSFEANLRAAWSSRRVPSGIKKELLLEAAGKCALCEEPCEHPEEAHIDRKDEELPHYCQHPHNLILLCASCHGRYDRGSKTLTNEVVRKRKDLLLSRLMEDVDRDIALAKVAEHAISEVHRVLAIGSGRPDPTSNKYWTALTGSLFASSGSTPTEMLATPSSSELPEKLQQAGELLVDTMPLTSGTLRASAERLGSATTFIPPTEADTWDYIEAEPVAGQCLRCEQQTPLEGYTCLNCEHSGVDHHGEVPCFVDRDTSPPRVEFEDARGESYSLTCKKCESEDLEFEFQSLCDYCRHVSEKDE